MNYHDELQDVVASNVNDEVLVFRGSTTGELISIAWVSAAIIVPVAIIAGLVFGSLPLFISLALPVVFLLVFAFSTVLQVLKRGRPEGYFEHRIALIKHHLKWKKCDFVVEQGPLLTVRTKQMVMMEMLEVDNDD